MAAVMGLDYGKRRIGIAVSDPDGVIASAVGCHRTPEDGAVAPFLTRIIAERGVGEIVVGLPLTADGRETDIARRARSMADHLRTTLDLPVHLADERFSSQEADRWLRQGGRRRRDKGERDAVAAELILQQFLDSRRKEG
jgi:putative Holliday junction resolvase